MPAWLPAAVAAFLCWGVWAFLPKLTTRYIDPKSAIVYEALGGMVMATGVLVLIGFKPAMDGRGTFLALVTGVLGLGGALAYLYALRTGPVVLISTLTALYPILAIALAGLVLHEPVSLRQWLGILLGLVAMLLIAS
ncbi:EamA family transporter [Methylomagnum sp.]